MSGTFSSFQTSLSALRYQRVAMDVASGNIANAGTDGYVRRRVSAEATGAPPQIAMWSRYEGYGDGVRVLGLERMADPLLDARVRLESGNQSYLDRRVATLERLESGVGEPGENGVAAALDDFRRAASDLANNPGVEATRSQLLARSATLADALRTQARNVVAEQDGARTALDDRLAEVGTLAEDLALTNERIQVAKFSGDDAGVLLDQRDRLALRLSQLTGATTRLDAAGRAEVTVGGVPLVTGIEARELVVTSAAGDVPVTFGARAADGTTTALLTNPRGEVGAYADLLSTTLPAYAEGLDAVARELADTVNTQHQAGFDRAGNPGAALFAYDPADPAGTLSVAITDPAAVAASALPGGVLDGSNGELLGNVQGVADRYQRLVNGLGSEVASTRRLAANQQALTNQVAGTREQLSGVSRDEEMLALVSAQRGFEAAAKVMSAVDSVLDTLINRMLR